MPGKINAEAPMYNPCSLRHMAAATPLTEDFEMAASTWIFGTGCGGGIQRAFPAARGIAIGTPVLGFAKPLSSDKKVFIKP
jgi:hypothetical protein